MKLLIVCLILITISHACVIGQTNSGQAKPPSEWSLSLKTGGAPWEKKFEVEVNQSGLLRVTEQDPVKIPKDPITKLTIQLPAGNAQEIYQQGLLAAQKVGVKERDDFADGTWMTIKLVSDGKDLTASYHFGQVQEEAPNVAKLFALINKHLPTEHHVY